MKLDITGVSQLELNIDLDAIVPQALNKAVPVLANTTKKLISAHKRTGDLYRSIVPGKAKKPKNGGYYVALHFLGTDEHGVRNGLKAAELEYGNSHQTATPFAERACHEAEQAIVNIVQQELERGVDAK